MSQTTWAGPDDQERREDDRDQHDQGKHKGQERRGDRRDDRQDHREDRREDRHDDRQDRREERRDDRPPAAYYRDNAPRDSGRRAYRSHWGDEWQDDYGVVTTGRCNTKAVLGVTGAITGGLIANRNAGGDRGIATILGALAGGLIGGAVGDAIDDSDRACIGQSLELVPFGRPVVWVNPRTQVSWRVVPIRDVSDRCREFDLYRSRGHERVVACRRGRGDWEFGDR
jgi:surface antigen